MLITNKEVMLQSFLRCAEGGLLDKDYLLVKLQVMVMNGDATEEEVQPIVDVLVPPVV